MNAAYLVMAMAAYGILRGLFRLLFAEPRPGKVAIDTLDDVILLLLGVFAIAVVVGYV